MSLFQNSVLTKYLQSLNKEVVAQKWDTFKKHFHNATIQENIRNSKEEQYQGEFLIDLFVNVLGYTKNPTPNFNLDTEYKNVKDSKKADGAILINNTVKAVIELKGTNTTDLCKVESQAFGYKNNQPDCVYVITSNFEKVRFYIDNAIEHLEFNLFRLTEADFKLLYLCLAFENIEKGIAKKIKDESVGYENLITKKLYHDYSVFKKELHHDLVAKNPQFDVLELFKKSQKLIDRFLFLFFGEDRQLLPPNSVSLILNQWKQLQDLDEETPLYTRFKKYFGYLNTGYKGKQYDVFAYNGGLFKPDEILDNIVIDDDLLYKHARKLSEYDFDSEVDVNILGHIFENSLNELDELKAELEGTAVDKTKTKRKKDGVFYTPKYITKYIVDNTIGKLCTEKKAELAIVEDDYITDKKRQKNTIKALVEKLNQYRNWLLQLTICDPACGSGAFLNQALDFLITEHKYIDELQAKLFGDAMVLSDVENSILENNLFGVDLNEESVEIAKLSLWLRTARPDRKLNDLNRNLKCGNSLIDDPSVAGDKAFNWQEQFPQVFTQKHKKTYHVTTALHDSRTSQRMVDHNVRELRDNGNNPNKNYTLLTQEEEIIITKTVLEIVQQDKINVLAYNICADHMHILLVCEEEEVPKIMQKIKGKTARIYNSHKGINPKVQNGEDKAAHLWTQKYGCTVVTDDTQLNNTINYIQNNREKHAVPYNKEINLLAQQLCTTYQQAFATAYKGGFDVVIGNPPYGAKLDSETQNYLIKKYIKGGSETAISFIKLSYDSLLKSKGEFGFIIPKSFSFSSNYASIREYVLDDIYEIIDCRKVWKEVLLEQIIFFFKKYSKTDYFNSGILNGMNFQILGFLPKTTFNEFGFYLNGISDIEMKIGRKINSSKYYICDIAKNSRGGIFQNKISNIGDTEVLGGAEIQRHGIVGIKGRIDKVIIENDSKCFIKSNSVLVQRLIAHIENPTEHIKITACLPERDDFSIVDTINQVTFDKNHSAKTYWILFNSKLINWYSFRFILAKAIRTMQFDNPITNRIPIPKQFNQQPFIEKADQILSLNKELQEETQKFQRSLQRKFELEELPKKLQDWYLLPYAEFVKELAKKKVKLSLAQEAEWEDYFTQESAKALALKTNIDTTDKQIDQMVYALYELTDDEISIVENS